MRMRRTGAPFTTRRPLRAWRPERKERSAGGRCGRAEGTRGRRRRRHVARPQPRRERLPLCRRTGGATRAARPGLRPVPAHRPGAAAVPQREPRRQRSRRLQALGGADRPLQGNVKLKGIIIMGEDDDSHPSEMRLYKNIPQMSFDDTDREPDQTFSLNRDLTGELEYATKISRFSNVYHLSIHISKNFGADTTKVFYIGLRGEWTELRRHEVTICNYEASANPADHRVHQVTPQTHFIS
ncbi:PITH domain-containing protein 1 isoform X1 [Phacochoerus africanus]|uniref:PITH domain-containing protein 1 isoform X1 n=1 Tax=Phacochoerus africanus TaxID=41426 RepID=UPI001FD90DC8|nr:PITH domain-containing protein 1 isoform X1 [Phacochoerus africanus]